MDAQVDSVASEVEATPAPPQAAPSNGTVDAPPPTVGGGKNIVLPRDAFNSRISAAAERGKRAAMAEADEQAKKHGFASMQDAFSTLAALKSGQANGRTNGQPKPPKREPAVEATTQPDVDPDERRPNGGDSQRRSWKEQRKLEAQMERAQKEREAERRNRLHEERRRKDAERRAEALEAEMAIREQAIMAGVKDVGYAVHLLRQNIEGKTADELKGFDEVKFFDELRGKQPYLFGERVVPVTTGTGGKGTEPTPPKPGQTMSGQAAAGQVDAKKMNNKEFNEHMAKRGLSLSVAGV
jgi:hypothetical protein